MPILTLRDGQYGNNHIATETAPQRLFLYLGYIPQLHSGPTTWVVYKLAPPELDESPPGHRLMQYEGRAEIDEPDGLSDHIRLGR